MPLLAEISNRLSGSTGSAVDALTKLQTRLDEVLGSEPPRQTGGASGGAPGPHQAATLLAQLDSLQSVLESIHNQIARLGAI